MYPVTLTDDIDKRVEEEPALTGGHGGKGVVAIKQKLMKKIMSR
jgi:hypothetical protein